jgi:segregation and condensation protein B
MHVSKESIEEIDKSIEEENIKKVEAALFIAGKFMSIQELVALTDVNPILLKKILEDLSDAYKDSGIDIVNKNNLWKMDVSQDYIWMVNKLASGTSEFTKAEQETLALIAYKQPMKQSIVVKIRGNKAYNHIKGFVERGLINKKKMGHTAELTLNDNFFDYFSLTGSGEENSFEIKELAKDELKENADSAERAEAADNSKVKEEEPKAEKSEEALAEKIEEKAMAENQQ